LVTLSKTVPVSSPLGAFFSSWKGIYSDYCAVTKPGLVFFILLSVYVNYSFASFQAALEWVVVPMLFGSYFSASGAHILNQFFEVKSDRLMLRTASRPFCVGKWGKKGVGFGIFLSLAGVLVHYFYVNPLTAGVTLATLLAYIFFYTPLKKITIWNTWVGAIAGALPALSGWSAKWNHLPTEAYILPLLIFFWQMPHFLALAYKYKEQYKKAGLRMFPEFDAGGKTVGLLMLVHGVGLLEISLLPYFFGIAGKVYFAYSFFLGVWLVWKIAKFYARPSEKLAGKVFMDTNFYLIFLYALILLEKQVHAFFVL